MKKMPEFVEDGFHFAVGQQRRLVAHRRREVPADQSEVRLPRIHCRNAGDQRIHPGATPLVLARIPVRVKRADLLALLVLDRVVLHLGVPHGRSRFLAHDDAEHPLEDVEHTVNDSLHREVGPEFLFVEVVQRLALLLRPIADVPRLQVVAAGEPGQVAILPRPRGFGLRLKLLQESLRLFTVVRHPVLQHEIRKIAEPEKLGLPLAQIENSNDDLAIVEVPSRRAAVVRAIHTFPHGGIVQVRENGEVARRLQREPPPFLVLRLRALPCRRYGAFRQPGEARLIVQDQLVGVRRVENVLGELGGQLRQLDVHLLKLLLSVRVQVRTVPPEIGHCFLEEPSPRARERFRFVGLREGLDLLPQSLVQSDARVELGDSRLDSVVCLPQLRVGGHPLQVPDHVHGVIERLRALIQSIHGVLICPRPGRLNDLVQPLFRTRNQLIHGGFDVLGLYLIEGNQVIAGKEGIWHLRDKIRITSCIQIFIW